MKEIIRNVKEINKELETLYATQYVLEQKGEQSSIIEDKIQELESRKKGLEEIIYSASLVK